MKIFIDGIEYDLVPKSSPDKKSERDWEIECFTDGYRNWWLQPNGFYTHQIFDCGLTASQLIRDKKIWAVRRKSDGLLFRVGDKFTNYNNEVIKAFEVDGNNIKVWVVSGGFYFLRDVSTLPPERTKLFTTEDGVDVSIHDTFWYVTKDFKLYGDVCTSHTGGKVVAHGRLGDKFFSTPEKAKEYVTLNKPCLSVTDVINILNKFENLSAEVLFPNYESKLIELAKSKL